MTQPIRRSALLGTWSLMYYDVIDADGQVIAQPLGRDAVGQLVYTPDGFVSVHLMRRHRPHYDRPSVDGGTDVQMSAAARGYQAYCGRFDIDEPTGMVRHHLTAALVPNWLEDRQIRFGLLHAGLLTLCGDATEEFGVGSQALTTWCRHG